MNIQINAGHTAFINLRRALVGVILGFLGKGDPFVDEKIDR